MLYNKGKIEEDFMKYYSRRRETIQSVIYIIVGLIGLYLISVKLQAFDIDEETVIINEQAESLIDTESEKDWVLNIDELYEWSKKPLNETNVRQLLKEYLPGGRYLKEVSISQEKEPYNISLTYASNQYDKALSRAKKDQIALMDASILMSLYPDIDTVKVSILIDQEIYSKVLYRPDLEEYFGIELVAQEGKNTFERVAKEFTEAEEVSKYWESKHSYDSTMGEEVEAFYKMNFKVQDEENEIFPYIDEDLESTLVEKYGYKLFLQGLEYDNALMKYYSAYRLIEYYGKANTDAIMLELATCQTKSKDKRVRAACEAIIDLLRPLKEDEIRVFGRFQDNTLGGGKKLYTISGKGLAILAKWIGEDEAGLKVVSVSPDEQYVLCMATIKQQCYYYILSSKEESYEIKEDGIYKDQEKRHSELISRMEQLIGKQEVSRALNEDKIEWKWYFDSFMEISINDDIVLIYDANTDSLQKKEQFNENFDAKHLEKYLEGQFDVSIEKSQENVNTKAEIKNMIVNGEVVTVYEYANVAQKNIEVLEKEKREEKQKGKVWSKGKIRIYYEGDSKSLIKALNEIMK